jgi:hypothetical protein
MIQVEFRSVGPGTCSWCEKESPEVATVAFADKSFVGSMCWKDLQRALKMKLGTGNGAVERRPILSPTLPVSPIK